MNNLLNYKGYFGSIEISIEDNTLHGKLECINDLVTYEAPTVPELKAAFEEAVDDYLSTCEEIGKNPDKTMSGTFNVRIGQSLHKKAYLAAKAQRVTLNDYIKRAVVSALSGKSEYHIHIGKAHEVSEFTFGSLKKNEERTRWKATNEKREQH